MDQMQNLNQIVATLSRPGALTSEFATMKAGAFWGRVFSALGAFIAVGPDLISSFLQVGAQLPPSVQSLHWVGLTIFGLGVLKSYLLKAKYIQGRLDGKMSMVDIADGLIHSLKAPIALIFLALTLTGCPAGYWSQARKDAINTDIKTCAIEVGSTEWNTLTGDIIKTLQTALTDFDAMTVLVGFINNSAQAETPIVEDCITRIAGDLERNFSAADAGTILISNAPAMASSTGSARKATLALDPTKIQHRAALWVASHPR